MLIDPVDMSADSSEGDWFSVSAGVSLQRSYADQLFVSYQWVALFGATCSSIVIQCGANEVFRHWNSLICVFPNFATFLVAQCFSREECQVCVLILSMASDSN